jgi:hypothetical protein
LYPHSIHSTKISGFAGLHLAEKLTGQGSQLLSSCGLDAPQPLHISIVKALLQITFAILFGFND